ncbi:hypothetical protein F5B22DRAFT_644309 [Xylaria bambusicola]|uniref:uncharacterized protein n=1 Tax=Xylaria bambusicola TaxID=326684 RepID=UPI002007CB15|nr:uncharacterized protein F5B22DRAFT_644309 [Xylaria bambusicola]KAI0521066.1 hypothetical protein F5B22DRAFT_644309 [Xylaria bambusicola]
MNNVAFTHQGAVNADPPQAEGYHLIFQRGPRRDTHFLDYPIINRDPPNPFYSPIIPNYNNTNENLQNNFVDDASNTSSIHLGRGTTIQNVPTTESYSPFAQPTQVQRRPLYGQPGLNVVAPPYTPMPRFRVPDNAIPTQNPVQAAMRAQIQSLVYRVSPNYQGDPTLSANQPANIPDDLNTSVWITNLPPNLDHRMLLGSVRNCGKVYAAVVNPPEQGHMTSASKIVFFDVAGAQSLLRQYHDGTFVVNGYMPRVVHNRIRTRARPPSPVSRVLHIEGPSSIVNREYLAMLFRSDDIIWQDEVVVQLAGSTDFTRLEWRFGSYRCQAESARHLIDRVKRVQEEGTWEHFLWQCVTVNFGVDPCAPQPDAHI